MHSKPLATGWNLCNIMETWLLNEPSSGKNTSLDREEGEKGDGKVGTFVFMYGYKEARDMLITSHGNGMEL